MAPGQVGIFLTRSAKFLAVADHFTQTHAAYDLTHVAFQNLSLPANVLGVLIQEVFCCLL